jgi:Kazal-type serine protease inhibitor domain
MYPTHLRLAARALLAVFVIGSGACALEAVGLGPELPDASAITGDSEGDAATAASDAGRAASDAGMAVPVDAARPVPVADASPPARDAAVPPRPPVETDAGVAPPDAGAVVTRCGTRGGIRCALGAFCNFAPDLQCGATDRGGVCQSIPSACPAIYDPVCGCDNVTYPNACQASAFGVSVKRAGMCGAEECQIAGGRVRGGGSCGRAVAFWEITRAGGQPGICCVGEPVEPTPTPVTRTCGGIAGSACSSGSFCNFERAAGGLGCSVPDATGICMPKPEVCTREYAPVCGCDRRTYATACIAHASGVAVLREGECGRDLSQP